MLNSLKKNLIILFVVMLIFCFSINVSVLATDIDMNLPSEETNVVPDDANVVDNMQDSDDQNTIENIQDSLNDTVSPQDDIGGDATPTSVSSIAQENMSFSNILNILIITVGVILILLAIAILVRLKS